MLDARDAKRQSWQATRRYARINVWPPAVGSPRPRVQRLLSKAPICSLLPPRSIHLSSTIPLGLHASPLSTPAPNPQLEHSTPASPSSLQTSAQDNDASAAAEHLSNTSLSNSLRDREQAQHVDTLCDATRHYIQLGCPNPPPLTPCNHLSSHLRPDTTSRIGNLTVDPYSSICDDHTYIHASLHPLAR